MQISEPKPFERERYYWAHDSGGVLCDTEEEAKAILAGMGRPNVKLEKRYVKGAGHADESL